MKKALPWVLAIYIVFVFVQSLFFKFSGSQETEIIFGTIGEWMSGIGFLAWLAAPFAAYGGAVVGAAELFASILLLIPRRRVWGALISFCAISGAIFFHLFTPLGVVRVVDASGNTDGGTLFFLACGVWVCAVTLLYLDRQRILQLLPERQGADLQ